MWFEGEMNERAGKTLAAGLNRLKRASGGHKFKNSTAIRTEKRAHVKRFEAVGRLTVKMPQAEPWAV